MINCRHLFIVNPKAGRGKTMEIIPKLEEHFKHCRDNCTIEITEYPGHASEIARCYTSREICRVYAVGGDGTLNEVLNGMAGTSSFLGVIPCGSGNDFIKTIYPERKGRDLIKETIHGTILAMDIGKVQDRYFLNISSAGIDAEVAYNMNRFKSIPFLKGVFAYFISVVFTIFKYKSRELKIKIDKSVFKFDSTLVAIANGRYYGGGFIVAPEAKVNDGSFDICVVSKISRLRMLVLFPKLLNGTHGEIPEVSFHRGRSVNILSNEEMAVNVDGEIIKSSDINFEIIEKGINFIVPLS